jgi:benzoylformate decarboxylase
MLLHEPLLVNSSPQQICAPYVKWAYETVRPEDAPDALMRAYAVAVQEPMGPVLLSIPMDDFEKPYNKKIMLREVEGRLGADADLLKPVLEALQNASSPVLILGGAVDQFNGWHDAIKLAESLAAKVWAPPFEARPGFPENYVLYHGVLPPAIAPLCEKLAGHDVIVVIGAPVFRY